MVVLVDQFPAWCDVYQQVAALLHIETIADALQLIAVAGSQLVGSIDVAHARQLQDELLGTAQQVAHIDIFALQQFMIQEELVAVDALYILGSTEGGSQIHIQQIGCALDIELTRRNTEFLVVVLLVLYAGGTRTGQHEEYTIQGNALADTINQLGNGTVEGYITLHLGGYGIADAEQVGLVVECHSAVLQTFYGNVCHAGVRIGRGTIETAIATQPWVEGLVVVGDDPLA